MDKIMNWFISLLEKYRCLCEGHMPVKVKHEVLWLSDKNKVEWDFYKCSRCGKNLYKWGSMNNGIHSMRFKD